MPVQIAVATRCFAQRLRESLRSAAACGARGVQFDTRDELPPESLSETGRRDFLHRLDEVGLVVAGLTFSTRRSFYEEELLDARVAAIRRAMEFAWQLRSRVLSVRIGKIPAETDSRPYRLLFEVLSDLARHGNQTGVTLAVTPLHDSPAALAGLVDSIKTGPLGIDFDPAAFVMAGHKPEDAYRSLHSFVAHVQARDAIRDLDSGGLEVALGRGEVDWIELLPLLDEANYRGWVTAVRTQGDDRAGDVARAVSYLKNVMMEG